MIYGDIDHMEYPYTTETEYSDAAITDDLATLTAMTSVLRQAARALRVHRNDINRTALTETANMASATLDQLALEIETDDMHKVPNYGT